MTAISVTVQSLEDVKAGKPLVEGIEAANIHEADQFQVAILERGTKGGQTSLMFILEDGHGNANIAQMTGNQFEMLVGAFRGALERFGR